MTKRKPVILLQHMLTHAQEALELIENKTRSDLDTDRLLNLALVRLLEIIGEAANRIPKEEQIQHRQIPWSQIIGLRQRLIHGYDAVDFDILWQIVTQDLPPLVEALKAIVSSND